MPAQKNLLVVIELGGYPDFSELYKSMGYAVHQVNSVRKAIRFMKQVSPDIIVAEFNFQSDFRDRTSSLESLLSTVQSTHQSKVVIFYEQEFAHQLARLTSQYPISASLAFPIEQQNLAEVLARLAC